MSSKGQTYFPFGNNLPPGTINVNYGGTGCTSPQEVVEKFNAVTKTSLGANGGIASFTAGTGKIGGNQINKTAIKQAISYLVTTYEQGYLNVEQSIYLNIEGYDESIDYSISIDRGTFSKENNVITITAPAEPGSMTLTFNGKNYTFEVIKSELATPSITSPVNNATGLMPATTFTSSMFAIQREDAPTSTHSMSSWELSTSVGFEEENIIKHSRNDTTNKNMWSVTDMPLNTQLYLRVRYRNSNGIWSDWSTPITFKTIAAKVNTPSIISPTPNTTLYTPTAINLVASEYSVLGDDGSTFPHTGTDWQVSTNNTFTAIVKSVTNDSTNKTTWTATGLTKQTTYYIRVRYNNATLGYSDWSSTLQITTPNYFTDASGRTFYRHESGMGTVMGWVDKKGVRHQTLVLDASYRNNKLAWSPSDTLIPGMNNHVCDPISGSSYYYLGSNVKKEPLSTSLTTLSFNANEFFGTSFRDDQIHSQQWYFEDNNSGKYNTTAIISSIGSSTTYGVGFCRSKKVIHNGTTYSCDLPNIQTLIRIYCSMFMLDELDPTPNGNGNLFTRKRSGMIENWYNNIGKPNYSTWTRASTQVNKSATWSVNNQGSVWPYAGKTSTAAITPVLELELITSL